MSIVCSSHNLCELEKIRIDLQVHYYALDLLLSIPGNERPEEWDYVHANRCEALGETIKRLAELETCIRAGHDFNPAPWSKDLSPDDAESSDDEPSPDDPAWLA